MTRQPFTQILALTASLLALAALFAAPASAATLHVPGDHGSVGAAIDAAAPGDTVQVAPGTYRGTIRLKPGVTVRGSGPDSTTLIGTRWHAVRGSDDATLTGFTVVGYVYGVKNRGTSPTIRNSTVRTTFPTGTGIHNRHASPTILNVTITENEKGIWNTGRSSPVIANSLFLRNTGHGIFSSGTCCRPRPENHPQILNNLFIDNTISVSNHFSTATVANNIILRSRSDAVENHRSAPTLANNLLWENHRGIRNYGSSVTATDNRKADPLLRNLTTGDHRLRPDSPAIDSGTDAAGLPQTDAAGRTRVTDGDGDGIPVVDIGPYEFGRAALPATVDLDPDTLNHRSRGRWITGYVELPGDRDAAEIAPETVRLNGEVPVAPRPATVGDADRDGVPDLTVKFDRAAAAATLRTTDGDGTVTGELADGTRFEGADTVRLLEGEERESRGPAGGTGRGHR